MMEMMVMVTVMMLVSGSERRTRKHHQKQNGCKNLFHGPNVTRSGRLRKISKSPASNEERGFTRLRKS
jgi:hypothetical protein